MKLKEGPFCILLFFGTVKFATSAGQLHPEQMKQKPFSSKLLEWDRQSEKQSYSPLLFMQQSRVPSRKYRHHQDGCSRDSRVTLFHSAEVKLQRKRQAGHPII